MKLPKILIKVFSLFFILVLFYIVFVFYIFIPKIEQSAISMDDALGKAQLSKTLQLVQQYSQELKYYKQIALEERKNELRKLTDIVYDIIEINYQKSLQNPKDLDILQRQTLDLVAKLKYANNDYFYISDYNSTLISHPYLKNKDFSNITDINGHLIVPPLVKVAREKGEGFIRYWWKKNTQDSKPYEKLTYARDFAPWKWVVGTGVYIDDIQKEIDSRKVFLINKLKHILRTTKIGKNGYVYIFDSHGNMIIHPNSNIEGVNFRYKLNPGKKTFLFDDLIEAYKSGKKTLYYNWDTPKDKGNYIYKKISWIEYSKDFDWYICSSDYTAEVHADSDNLKRFIISSTLIMVFLLIFIGSYILKQIFNPIVEVAQNAQKVINGDLKARYKGKVHNDEIGLLAMQFNHMLDTINTQMDTLDLKVQEKTDELTKALHEKEILLREVNHRVKNNLYVINSIIGLQLFQNECIKMEEFVKTIQQRINAMAIAHDMLSDSENITNLKSQEYIPLLVDSLIKAYIKNPEECECVYDIDPIPLELDKLLACGLIINELVTNIIKYAFISKENYLFIGFKEYSSYLELTIIDRGKGFDISIVEKGVGLELVTMLVGQLNGTISFENHNGTQITIKFK